jgi:hypothetical protein
MVDSDLAGGLGDGLGFAHPVASVQEYRLVGLVGELDQFKEGGTYGN